VVRPSPRHCGLAVDRVAGHEGQLLGALRPDEWRPQRSDVAATDGDRRLADAGVVGDDGDVGVDAHLRGAGDAVAVHRGDHRLRVVPDREKAVEVALQSVAVTNGVRGLRHTDLTHVVPGREALALPADGKHRPSCGLEGFQGIRELVEEVVRQGVRPFRSVEHDPREVVLVLQSDVFVVLAHRRHHVSSRSLADTGSDVRFCQLTC